MAVNPSPFGPKPAFFDAAGAPDNTYKLFTYIAGSNTKQNTYTSSTGAVANSNPIILNTLGMTPNEFWFTASALYKVVLAPSTDTDPPSSPIWTIDNLRGINDPVATVTQDEWVQYGAAVTYVSATSFTVAGNATTTFQIGRRVKTTNTGGTVYSTITNSVFGALTTVTVVNDSGVLDSGLSVAYYGLLSVTNPSIPSRSVTTSGLTMSTARVLGRTTASTGAIEELTAAQVATFADAVTLTGNQTIAGVKTFSNAPIFSAGFGAGNTNQSCIRLASSNGYGSTNTKIKRFLTTLLSQGTDITYADSATLGALFTINVAGVYAISYSESGTIAINFGVSVNASSLTTNISGIAASERIANVSTNAANQLGSVSTTIYLASGSLVRPHTDGTAVGTPDLTMFTITRVS